MIRSCEVKIDGYDQPFKIKSMTVSEADEYVKQSKEMLANRETISGEEWLQRVKGTVSAHTVSPENILSEIDLKGMNELNQKILEFSGLRTGEATAVSALPNSEAA